MAGNLINNAVSHQVPPRGPLTQLAGSDLLDLGELNPDLVRRILDRARQLKAHPAQASHVLAGRSAILLFEKPSLRTRISFEVGIAKLGGHAIYMDHSQQKLGERESVVDYGRNLERWVDVIIARVFHHHVLEEMAWASRVPVINALSDVFHPCQALADVLTLEEKLGTLRGARVAFVGDGNNVCHSLVQACALTGASITVITPKGFEPQSRIIEQARSVGERTGAIVTVTTDPAAVAGAQALYTDVWLSMGQADVQGKRMKAFARYQVNAALMAKAGPAALFMHCLPAHRGVEVTDDVIDAPTSVVYDQAENRMWAQNAVLAEMFENAQR